MARLTPREKRLLRRTGDWVRMYLACISVLCPILCVVYAYRKYADVLKVTRVTPEIPPLATYGTITGIYLPVFAAVAAYVWATRAGPVRTLAPRGFAMALFRDAFTLVVVTVALGIPVLLYKTRSMSIQDANPYLTWYQTVMTALAGGAFTYYFHANLDPTVAAAERPQPDAAPAPRPAGAAAPGGAPRPRRPRRSPKREEPGGGEPHPQDGG